jgi:membrane-associated phospholipid phosphatase
MLNRPAVRLIAAMLLVFGGLWLHEMIQTLADPLFVVDGALERSIPFIPWTIWIYFSFFLLIAWTALVVREALFIRFVLSATLAALVAWAVVLAVPISFERPDPASIAGSWHREIFAFVHTMDPSHITFPSLHVAVTWVCTFTLWTRSRRGWLLVLGIAISLSTLFTKQHLVADVVGGIALAYLCIWLTGKLPRMGYGGERWT